MSADAHSLDVLLSGPFQPGLAAPGRLARRLGLPSVAEIDEATQAEIDALEQQRDALLAGASAAAVVLDARPEGDGLRLASGSVLPADPALVRAMREDGSTTLVLATFSLGAGMDAPEVPVWAADDPLAAFVRQQWGITLAEQTRATLSRTLARWAAERGRALTRIAGPGYGDWPLESMAAWFGCLPPAIRPDLSVLASGALRPAHSMVFAHAVLPARSRAAAADPASLCPPCTAETCRCRPPRRAAAEPSLP